MNSLDDIECLSPNLDLCDTRFSDDVDLKDIFDQNDILSECRFHNPSAIEFFSKPATLSKLIDLITSAPILSQPLKLQYKYSQIATELILIQSESIINALVSSIYYHDSLYTFLQSKSLSPISIGHVRSIFCCIAQYDKSKFLAFLSDKNDFTNIILTHLDKTAIIDLVFELIKIYEGQSESFENDFLKFILNGNIIIQTLNLFTETRDAEIRISCIQLLSGLLLFSRLCQNHLTTTGSATIKYRQDLTLCINDLESEWFINSILEVGFRNHEDEETCLISSIFYLRSIIDNSINVESGFQLPLIVREVSPSELRTLIENENFIKNHQIDRVISCLLLFIETICDKICNETKSSYGSGNIHMLRNIVQFLHVGIVNFCSCSSNNDVRDIPFAKRGSFSSATDHDIISLASNFLTLLKILIDKRFFVRIIDQMFLHPWNSFLHASVNNLVEIFINTSIEFLTHVKIKKLQSYEPLLHEENNNDTKLVHQLSNYETFEENLKSILSQILVEANLLDRILREWSKNKENVSNGKPNAGFTGHLRSLSNLLHTNIVRAYQQKICKEEKAKTVESSDDGLEEDPMADLVCETFQKLTDFKTILDNWNNFIAEEILPENELTSVSYHILSETELLSEEDENYVSGSYIDKIHIDETVQQEYDAYNSEIQETPFAKVFGLNEDEFNIIHDRGDIELELRFKEVSFKPQINEESSASTIFEIACNEIIKYNDNNEEVMDVNFKNVPPDEQSFDENSSDEQKNDFEEKAKDQQVEGLVQGEKASQKSRKKKKFKTIPIRVLNEVFGQVDQAENLLKKTNSTEDIPPPQTTSNKTSTDRHKCSFKLELSKTQNENPPFEKKYEINNYLPQDVDKQRLLINNKNCLYKTHLNHQINQNKISKFKLEMNKNSI